MKYQELLILLPCYGLEDFPLHHVGNEAEGLLACWTALWHPNLVASAQAMPRWHRTDDALTEYAQRLIVVPAVSERELASSTASEAIEQGACLIRGLHDRNAILALALAPLEIASAVEEELAADFLALGYCYLQVELLTRQMRYSSNLDEEYFQKQFVSAAQAAVEGRLEQARQDLAKCFDVLAEERDHYYPVDAYVIDLSLVGPTTMGRRLRQELSRGTPVNVTMPAAVLEQMAVQQPDSLVKLRAALQDATCCCLAGPARELPMPLLSCETLLGQLKDGLSLYERFLHVRPTVYGMHRFGLTPILPQILHKLGFEGALHATFDDGRFPESNQSKAQWEGIDGTAIDVLARVPLDATKPETFLNLASKISESMESDHVATLGLAHWSGQSSCWYEDLRRCARYTPALGKLTTMDEFFQQAEHAGHEDRFTSDQYRSPYLKQAVAGEQNDPISRFVRYWRQRVHLDTCQSLATWLQLLSGREVAHEARAEEVDRMVDCPTSLAATGVDGEETSKRMQHGISNVATALARQLAANEGTPRTGHMLINPHSFVRRVEVEWPDSAGWPADDSRIYSVGRSQEKTYVVVDVPAAGFVWLASRHDEPSATKSPVLAEENVLRNEFFEAHIDPATGSIRSMYDFHTRGNRMSQQLAMRLPDAMPVDGSHRERDEGTYSVMVADAVEITSASPAMGEITSRGKLVDDRGRPLASFVQQFRVWRGRRVLSLKIELQPSEPLGSDPWESYYACRFAWSDETADLYRSVNLTRQPTSAKRLEAPLFVEIQNEATKTTILTAGLPYHRRTGSHMLDSLLIVRGETARHFRLGIGIDVRQSLHESLAVLASPVLVRADAPSPASSSGWLFHLDGRSVVTTFWEPLLCAVADGAEEQRNSTVGFRVRLLETAGRSGRVTLSAFRPIVTAQEVDFQGKTLSDCRITEGKIQLDMSAYQWSEIEARWQA